MNKIELLAPAGDIEKLKIAIAYGADAVYFGGEMFSLRAGAGNLSTDEIKEGVAFAHSKNVKCYLAMNIFAHNEDIEPLKDYLIKIKDIPIDAFIVSDPGIISLIKQVIHDAELHLSTQANMTNYQTANFWHSQGIKRIVLARELTFNEVKEIIANIPKDMDIEAFVHGAMCISYSGRCLLSNFMTERDANRGACSHPCRWKYNLVEKQRPEEKYPIEEDERGTYILNSKDLCMLKHIPTLIESGISSAKIEGRMKSVYYIATVVGAYRKAIDEYYKNPKGYQFNPLWFDELVKASHREFTTGFYFNKPTNEDQNYQSSAYIRDYDFTGIVKSYDENTQMAVVEQRNKMVVGDNIEIFGPDFECFSQKLEVLKDEEGNAIEQAPHPKQIIQIKINKNVKENYMIRKEK